VKERDSLNADSGWRPATSVERYQAIDILRGLALFGVLVVNMLTGFRVPLLEHILTPHTEPGWANRLVDVLVAGALEFKALTIFSFLFGVGVAIQAERSAFWKVSARRFLVRRLAWLFILGAAHLFLIWNGDILALYAMCGLFLVPFFGLSWPALLVIGAAAIAVPEVADFGPSIPSGEAARELIEQARQVYGSASLLRIVEFRWHESWLLIVPLLIGILPRTTGLMYWGMAAWRSGILREPDRHRGKLVMALVPGAALGTAVTVNEVWASSSGSAPWPVLRAASSAGPILLALAYVSGLLLWLKPLRASTLPGLAAVGRMALTNYLLQSIVLGFVFYGYGFGLFGRIGSAAAMCIGLAIYATQLQLSRLWLRRFRFGPFEWLWRSLAYGQRQPMRRRQGCP
jgi:uncharacterized protein